MIFVDTNVLIDVLTPDQEWRSWSHAAVLRLSTEGAELVIDVIVLAELASNFPDLGTLLTALDDLDIGVLPLTEDVAFEAGIAFRADRRLHRQRTAILSDFLIGGHAATLGARLLTRDRAIYARYFPDLTLITPETDA